jgi:hypothetical protein
VRHAALRFDVLAPSVRQPRAPMLPSHPSVLRFLQSGVAVMLTLTGLARAAEPAEDNVAERLRDLPRPWTERIHRLTLPEYQATLEYWGGKFRDRLNVEQRGRSTSGFPLYLLKITDHAVLDADKQVCLVTALHGGPERSGSTTALRLVEWLLSDAPAAVETRRKQVVLVMPIPNPYAFFVTDRFGNEQGLDVYNPGPAAWDLTGPKLADPARTPEIAAILSVVDEYRPEIHADLHGTGLQAIPDTQLGDRTMFRGQTMFVEVLGAISNSTLRPWDWRISEAIDDGARAAGYGLDRNEADGQRLFWGPGFETMTDRVWMGRPLFYTAHYGYAKYHTMIATLEIGWEESGLARMQSLFRIGNERWRDEDCPGYPVDKLRSYVGLFVTAYGETAAARRSSRTELWSKQGGFALANFYPQTDGHGVYVCAVTPAAIATLHENIDETLAAWRNFPGLKSSVVEQFVRLGPEQIVTIQPADRQHAAVTEVEHGISLRTRIPNRDPRLLDVRLNGTLLPESRVDGYHTWYADGWTYLQVNVPPGKARALGLLVFTYAYRPDTVRTYGFEPPAEVREKLRGQ